jgi:cell division protein FtsQ
MSRRRISIRKIIQTLVTLVAVSGCAVALISAGRRQAERPVRDVSLVVERPQGVDFLNKESVHDMLFTRRHIEPAGQKLSRLNEHSMEAILSANPWVDSAEVFADAQQVLHVWLRQRVPFVRIFEEDGNSYYVDAALRTMPLSSHYTHYAPVVTGVPKLKSDSARRELRGRITGMVRIIARDTFWSAQVSQINMRADGGFEIVPVLGKQRIILGDTSDLQDKLDKLFAFYEQVQNRVGWNRYTTLDLRYKGQVVASPKLSWKVPVDHALSNINWLQAVMDNAPKQDLPGGDGAANSDQINNAASTPAGPDPPKP